MLRSERVGPIASNRPVGAADFVGGAAFEGRRVRASVDRAKPVTTLHWMLSVTL
jgi:hypothetical protein